MTRGLLTSLIAVLMVAVLVFLLIRTMAYVLGALARGMGRLFAGASGTDRPPPFAGGSGQPTGPLSVGPVRMCGNEDCRHANVPGARYCAQCGRPLTGPVSAADGGPMV
ncbi:MAG TPA: zinc ribbon domain-containing protein [Phycisphaerae bacterium]|nr:zinc ribbon domain-containing protein [Phycisphaerae bacterium]